MRVSVIPKLNPNLTIWPLLGWFHDTEDGRENNAHALKDYKEDKQRIKDLTHDDIF